MPALLLADSQNLVCTIFPFLQKIQFPYIQQLCNPTGELTPGTVFSDAKSIATTIVSFIFVAIIIIAVYIIIKAAIKYIRSEGDETKIQEAQKAIKSVFIGLIALFVGIIGLVLILVIFNALNAVSSQSTTDVQQQLTTPGSVNSTP